MKEYLKYFISIIIGMIMACFLYGNISDDILLISL
jgi:hypothetical protein